VLNSSQGTKVSEEKEVRKHYFQESIDFHIINAEIVCYRGDDSDPQWMDIERCKLGPFCIMNELTPL
jgi:hypothetical protein